MIARSRKFLSLLFLLPAILLAAVASAADEEAEPIVVEDAAFGEVLFYFYQEDYFPAIVRLLAAQEKSRLENHIDESRIAVWSETH